MAGRFALIVATDDYADDRLRRLRAPAHDAEALAEVLRDPDIGAFDVRLLANESEAALRRGIATFFADRRRDDLLLLHFSCHGLKDDSGQLYFAARDTDVAQLDASAVGADFVSRQMARSRSSSVLMLLDCCYSGAIARGLTFRAGDQVDVNDHLSGTGRAVITASSAMEYAFEGDDLTGEGQPSVFTSAVVKALETGEADRDQDHWISVRELYDYVCDEVRELTPSQRPNMLSFLEGELFIARSRYVAPVALPPELLDALSHPVPQVRVGAVEALAELLAAGKPGLAAAARERLARVAAEDDSRRVTAAADAALTAEPPLPAAAPPPPAPTAGPEVPAEVRQTAAPPEPAAQPRAVTVAPDQPARRPISPPLSAGAASAGRAGARAYAAVAPHLAWPLAVAALGALAVVYGWTHPWTYDANVPDLIDSLDKPADGLLSGLLVPAGLAVPLLAAALAGRRARLGWWALLLAAAAAIGVVLAVADRLWDNQWHAGAPITTAGLLALAVAAVAMARRAPALGHPAWPGDALALAGTLVAAVALRGPTWGSETQPYLRHVLAGACLAAALASAARLLQIAFAARLVPAVAAVAAAATGLAMSAGHWAVAAAAAIAALGAVYAAPAAR